MQTYTYEEAFSASLEYFGDNELPAKTFIDKYALRNSEDKLVEKTPDDMHRRMAKEFARIEKKKFKKPYSEEFIYNLFKNFSYLMPQGSPMYGIGNNKYVSLSNCVVVDSVVDSYSGICYTDEQLVQLCKRRCGVGVDISNIRPNGFLTNNSSRSATGIVPFMERFSNSIREVGQNNRRGALMLTLNVHHPQILDFATVKNDPLKVTGANVSSLLTDEFLTAVDKDTDYELRWPIDNPKYISKIRARVVWDTIINSAWERAEPGLLFIDTIRKESPADCYAKFGFLTISTNPCSEIPLAAFDCCRLLCMNLFSFVSNPFTNKAKFNYNKFYNYAMIAQRLMDDLVDLELEAIDRIIHKIDKLDTEEKHLKQREIDLWKKLRHTCATGRRTGTGITALGDTLAALNIKYDSPKGEKVSEKIYKLLKLACYESSIDMAKELGPFPIWDKKLEKDCPFLLRIKNEHPDLYKRMQKYGRRNIALLTTAPVGSGSLLAGSIADGPKYYGTTSGIESLFMMSYIRRKKICDGNTEKAKVAFIDAKGDKWEEFPVYHPKLKMWMDVTGETDITKSPYYGACAEDLDWKQRVRMLGKCIKHIDHSISCTINLPEDVTKEEVAEIYTEAWKRKLKGITVYRKNCRSGVLVEKPSDSDSSRGQVINKTSAPKRAKEMQCNIHSIKRKGIEYYVLVGLLNNEPYETFIIDTSFNEGLTILDKTGTLTKIKRGHYNLKTARDDHKNITRYCTNTDQVLTRLVSTSLRHGVDISFIVHQLEKAEGDIESLSKCLVRVLKTYIKDGTKVSGETCPNCQSESIIRQEGCLQCSNCAYSKCG